VGPAADEAEASDETLERIGEERESREPPDVEDEEDHEELDELTGSPSEKALHRAIPSWSEAVNIVIAANLESRAKNPDRRQRPHGNRGRDNHGD
jgi:hypothetical protein